MSKRCAFLQGFVLIFFTLCSVLLVPGPAMGADSEWESLSGSGSQPAGTSSNVTSSSTGTTQPSSSLKDGRTIAVISNTDRRTYKLFRDWAGRENSIQLILEPSSLDDLGKKLETLGRARKVAKLILMGHGRSDSGGISFITTPGSTIDAFINENSFRTLKRNRPGLGKAFAPGAQLVFFNCIIGRNEPFLRAAGEAFLGAHGGVVIANTDITRYITSRDQDGNAIISWIDSPKWWSVPWNYQTVIGNLSRWLGRGWVTVNIAADHSN